MVYVYLPQVCLSVAHEKPGACRYRCSPFAATPGPGCSHPASHHPAPQQTLTPRATSKGLSGPETRPYHSSNSFTCHLSILPGPTRSAGPISTLTDPPQVRAFQPILRAFSSAHGPWLASHRRDIFFRLRRHAPHLHWTNDRRRRQPTAAKACKKKKNTTGPET